MNKRKAKSIAYNYFASLVDEMVNNCDWSVYSLKGWAKCAITARRIRENSTDYWGS
jgi:hypothetical protein